ncbi:OLC1v1006258C1 [Oldenlandia corymbosa var. corymbosa]|uniref:OLC1v1006258C1 n=1 Tax=Oldenlandia corymbosa var. corymbosa TaxID=529605 RepID=A0AAV1DJK0_OLDCO|nr:OLC1v1006258C1 [Oldenlandia corymbosa var. corymbosa]
MESINKENPTQKEPSNCSYDYKGSDDVVGHDLISVDRISNLPESIICHILSFLPTETVFATSFLSKSWRHHWTKVTDFHFDNRFWHSGRRASSNVRGYDVQKMNFVDFVHMILQNHSDEVSINRFRLRTVDLLPLRSTSLHTWVNTAISRNVRVLDLEIFFENVEYNSAATKFQLPDALYTCGTLEVLRLSGRYICVKLIREVCLPKLTDLLLNLVTYESDEAVCNLISGCSILQSLKIIRFHNDNVVSCKISSPSLKHLVYAHKKCGNHCEFDDELYLKLMIDTPALEYLSLRDLESKEIILVQALKSLNEVKANIHSNPPELVVGLVQGFHHVKIMKLSVQIMVSLMYATKKMSVNFARLTRLDISIDCCDHLSCLMHLIDCCSALEVLTVMNFRNRRQIRNRSWMNPVTVPGCFSSSLRQVYYWGFEGLEDEMAMFDFIANHALVLKKLDIIHPRNSGPHPKQEFSLLKQMFSGVGNLLPIGGMKFVEFVNMVLQNQGAGLSIHRFRLELENLKFDSDCLHTWLNTAIARNLRVFDLDVVSNYCSYADDKYVSELPGSLYTCGTLEVLKLSRPVLKSLAYRHNGWHSGSNVDLQHELKIDTPALECLSLVQMCPESKEIISLQPLTSLNKVNVRLQETTVGFIQALECVKFMKLSFGTVANFSGDSRKLSARFERLTELVVEIDRSDQLNYLMDLIEFCTALEILSIRTSNGRFDDGCCREPIIVPRCLLSSLSEVYYRGFEGREIEMAMFKFISSHALVMKRLDIFPFGWLGYHEKEISLLKEMFKSKASLILNISSSHSLILKISRYTIVRLMFLGLLSFVGEHNANELSIRRLEVHFGSNSVNEVPVENAEASRTQRLNSMEGKNGENVTQNLQRFADDSDVIPVDRISDLPESIICHILSFLTTKQVLATRFLSKSWSRHWTKVADFDFSDGLWYDEDRFPYRGHKRPDDVRGKGFEEYVSMVLVNHCDEIPINGFRLSVHNPKFHLHINPWVSAAIARQIRVLDLWLDWYHVDPWDLHKFQLPGELYTCGTLQALKLRGSAISLKVSRLVCLPKLRDLELIWIRYDSDDSLSNLISGSPVLQSLKIDRFRPDNMVVCRISSASLKHLEYAHSRYDSAIRFRVEIDTPALEYLRFEGLEQNEVFSFQRLTSLNELNLESLLFPHESVVGIIPAFDRVKTMKISSRAISTLFGATPNKPLARFQRLASLLINVDFEDELSCVTELIHCCPALEVLFIVNCRIDEQIHNSWRDPDTVPECLVSSLTHFTLVGFQGLEVEMDMLKFISNHALLLKEVDVIHSATIDVIQSPDLGLRPKKEFELLDKILRSSRLSPACKITLF